MSYELKDYLNAINLTKKRLMDSDDEDWEKKYAPFIINKCLAPFNDTIMLTYWWLKNRKTATTS